MPHFIIVLILYINLFNLSDNKMPVFEEYRAFNMLLQIRPVIFGSSFFFQYSDAVGRLI